MREENSLEKNCLHDETVKEMKTIRSFFEESGEI